MPPQLLNVKQGRNTNIPHPPFSNNAQKQLTAQNTTRAANSWLSTTPASDTRTELRDYADNQHSAVSTPRAFSFSATRRDATLPRLHEPATLHATRATWRARRQPQTPPPQVNNLAVVSYHLGG